MNSGFLRVKFQSDDSGYKFIFHGGMELGRNAFNQIHNLLGKSVLQYKLIYIPCSPCGQYFFSSQAMVLIQHESHPCIRKEKSFKRGSFITLTEIFFFSLASCLSLNYDPVGEVFPHISIILYI